VPYSFFPRTIDEFRLSIPTEAILRFYSEFPNQAITLNMRFKIKDMMFEASWSIDPASVVPGFGCCGKVRSIQKNLYRNRDRDPHRFRQILSRRIQVSRDVITNSKPMPIVTVWPARNT